MKSGTAISEELGIKNHSSRGDKSQKSQQILVSPRLPRLEVTQGCPFPTVLAFALVRKLARPSGTLEFV